MRADEFPQRNAIHHTRVAASRHAVQAFPSCESASQCCAGRRLVVSRALCLTAGFDSTLDSYANSAVLPTYCQGCGQIRTTPNEIRPAISENACSAAQSEHVRTRYMRDGCIYGSEGCRFESCRAHFVCAGQGPKTLTLAWSGVRKYCHRTATRMIMVFSWAARAHNYAASAAESAGRAGSPTSDRGEGRSF